MKREEEEKVEGKEGQMKDFKDREGEREEERGI